jgi:hypothetical protein
MLVLGCNPICERQTMLNFGPIKLDHSPLIRDWQYAPKLGCYAHAKYREQTADCGSHSCSFFDVHQQAII